jgi:cytochrome c-type biogenesis protein CcmH/NrfG
LAGGNARSAIDAYEHAVEINPGSAAFHAALGRACATAGDRGRARTEYEAALRIDPDNRDATIGLERL